MELPVATEFENRAALLWLAVIAAALFLYLPIVTADFVLLDDYAYVVNNDAIHQAAIADILNPQTRVISDWTPLVSLTHVVEWKLWGPWPGGYHVINLLLHLISVALAFALLRSLGASLTLCVIATAIFALHPLQVESVAWISSRKNLLAAVFTLASAYSWTKRKAPAAGVFLLLALLSKGTAVSIPLLWAALSWHRRSLREDRPWIAAGLVAALARGALSLLGQAEVIGPRTVASMSLIDRMSIMVRVWCRQLRQFAWPTHLSVKYFWQPAGWFTLEVVGALLIIAATISLTLLPTRHRRHAVLCWAWIVICLLPTANIFPAPDFQADRYLHLALLGAAVLVGLAVTQSRVAIVIAGLWITMVLVPQATARVAVWYDSETLWRATLGEIPQFAFAWNSLSEFYISRQRLPEAIDALEHALTINPNQNTARLHLASALRQTGRPAEAIEQYRTVSEGDPANGEAFIGMAGSFEDGGDRGAALATLDRALQQQATPQAVVRFQLAALALRAGLPERAAAELEILRAEIAAPRLDAALANVRVAQGRFDEAISLARAAISDDPNEAEAWAALGAALRGEGRHEEAAAAAQARRLARPPAR